MLVTIALHNPDQLLDWPVWPSNYFSLWLHVDISKNFSHDFSEYNNILTEKQSSSCSGNYKCKGQFKLKLSYEFDRNGCNIPVAHCWISHSGDSLNQLSLKPHTWDHTVWPLIIMQHLCELCVTLKRSAVVTSGILLQLNCEHWRKCRK